MVEYGTIPAAVFGLRHDTPARFRQIVAAGQDDVARLAATCGRDHGGIGICNQLRVESLRIGLVDTQSDHAIAGQVGATLWDRCQRGR